MNVSITYILLGSLSLSLLLSYIAIKLLKKHSILDIPGERSNHKIAVPRGGGIAIMVTSIIVLFVCIWLYQLNFAHLIMAIMIVGAISFIDDVHGLSPLTRSVFHIIAIITLMQTLPTEVNPYLWLFFVFGLYVFMNFYNFMDGIDGSATVGAIHIGFSTFIIAFLDKKVLLPKEISVIALVIIGTSCAFLLFNWSPAKAFLGDVGSITLGLICGWLMINLFVCGYMASSVIIPMYYMADSGLTLLIRIWKKKKIWSSHSEHFFQKAVRMGNSHAQVTSRIIIVNCILFVLSLLAMHYGIASLIIAVSMVLSFLYGLQTKTPH